MADGIVESVLGIGSDEPTDVGDGSPQATLDPSAAAAAMDSAQSAPELAQKIGLYFDDQRKLVDEQRRLVEDQRTRLRLRRTADRLRIGMQVFIALVATGVVGAFLSMIYDAAHSHSVVIEPFTISPALSNKGPSAQLAAQSVLDELIRLQHATRIESSRRRLSNSWTDEIKVEVPQLGMSIGEVERLLKVRLGHDVHINGDLVPTESGGLSLTVRGDAIMPRAFKGGPAQLDQLATEGAEYIYGQSQPALFTAYLISSRRYQEAIVFAKGAFDAADPMERPFLLERWADAIHYSGGSLKDSLAMWRLAVKLKPELWHGWFNLLYYTRKSGDIEGAWRIAEDLRKRFGDRLAPIGEREWHELTWDLQARVALESEELDNTAGVGSFIVSAGVTRAELYVRMHDLDLARLALQTAQGDEDDPLFRARTHFIKGRLAAEIGDLPNAVLEMTAFSEMYADKIIYEEFGEDICWVPPILESAGHHAKADFLLRNNDRFADCRRFKGDILAERGDWFGAQTAYQDAVSLAPDLPAAYYSWGLSLAKHGETIQAINQLKAANQRGPHWADPLKAWGDILAGEGKWKEALTKYDEALKYAPAWKELHEARNAAAMKR